jgi:2-polyprenyl-6-methoxyphenol hydroxylase-like FAD-dependent oxidoreductase
MNTESKPHRDRAIVIGGGIAGLLAARVLNDFYTEVVILDRDDLSSEGMPRRGAPQSRHAHGLLAGGLRVIEDLFPGISEELVDSGAMPADPQADGTWFFEGGPLCKTPSGTTGVLTSRPLLESTIRQRVRSLDGVTVVGDQTARELVLTQDRKAVTGVTTKDRAFKADLIIDATGRGTKSPTWLKSLGFDPAHEEQVEVNLVYTTRQFRISNEDLPGDRFVIIGPTPSGKRGGVLAIQENDRWIVTLFGHFGQIAPTELDGFMEYARSLPSPLIYQAIRDAEPLDEAATFRFPASTRRHYEDLKRFPEGFLVFGDAICSFNPIYGQGMSVAALQADALRQVLRGGRNDIACRFFKQAAAVIDNPWNIAVGADLRMPETKGPRTTVGRLINWYMANLHKQAHTDPVAAIAFSRVAQLLELPTTLMRPTIITRVIRGMIRRKLNRSRDISDGLLNTAEPRRPQHDSF